MSHELTDGQEVRDLLETWREGGPSREEVSRAYTRYRRGRMNQGVSDFALRPRLVALNFAYGVAAACVLLGAVTLLDGEEPQAAVIAVNAPSATTLASSAPADRRAALRAEGGAGTGSPVLRDVGAQIEIGGSEVPVQPGVAYEVAQGTSAVVRLGQERYPVSGPAVLEFQFTSDSASGWRMIVTRPPIEKAAVRSPQGGSEGAPPGRAPSEASGVARPVMESGGSAVPVPAPSVAELWTRAAEAMREGEQRLAEQAFSELAGEADRRTRDAASLALAQLWRSKGDTRALPILRRLSASGATPLIRKRAQELLNSE